MNNSTLDVHYVFASTFKQLQTKGLAYVLSKRLSEGHICLDTVVYNLNSVQKEENPFWKDDFDLLKICSFLNEVGQNKPIIIHNQLAYLNKYYGYESLLLNRIHDFKLNRSLVVDTDKLELNVSKFFELNYVQDWQSVAAVIALTSSFSIITGGPGTGKTTTVAKVLGMLYDEDITLKVGLAAPTGKAAARMNESLLAAKDYLNLSQDVKNRFDTIQASTLHRMLGYRKHSIEFRYNDNNFLPFDVVIVDESSMIDVAMMSRLMKAIHPGSRLLLLGDKNQLSSVEAGSVFGDLCQSLGSQMNHFSELKVNLIKQVSGQDVPIQLHESLLSDCVTELQVSHRFNGNVGIGRFSKDVIEGNIPDYKVCENSGATKDLVVVEDSIETALFNDLLLGYKTYILEEKHEKALKLLGEIRVLCVTREGEVGVKALNVKIEQFLKKQKVLNPTDTFYENQPLMITKNNALLGLYNGDIGLVRKDEKGVLMAFFEIDQSMKEIHLGYLTNVETVFTMTIHKSQGSEFKDVIVCLPNDKEMPLLTRELLYTGLTRAKERALIIGEKGVLEATISRRVQRASGIQQRVMS